MMIMQPEWITREMVSEASQQVANSKDLPALPKLRFEPYHEGCRCRSCTSARTTTKRPTIARLHNEFLPQNGYTEAGKHHEIYLSDPRRTAPEKLKTVLRQPVKKG